MRGETSGSVPAVGLPRLEPLRSMKTRWLNIVDYETGDSEGGVTIVLHGFPRRPLLDRRHTHLTAAGHRVIVPYLRGHGPTRYRNEAAPRSGHQAAIGTDVVELIEALSIPQANVAGVTGEGGPPVWRPPSGPNGAQVW